MTQLMVPVSKKNMGFIIYNHLFSKSEPFTLEQLGDELTENYKLFVSPQELEAIIKEYIDTGFVMHYFDRYIVTADAEEGN